MKRQTPSPPSTNQTLKAPLNRITFILLFQAFFLVFLVPAKAFTPIGDPAAVNCNSGDVFCASSCEYSDVESACQEADAYVSSEGDPAIVKLPSCPNGPSTAWADSIEVSGGLRIIGSGRKNTPTETHLEIQAGGRFFAFNYEAATRNMPIEVAHLYLVGEKGSYIPDSLVIVEGVEDAVIHHVDFENAKTHLQFRTSNSYPNLFSSGVVWDCTFTRQEDTLFPSQYGIRVSHGPDYSADSPFPVDSMYLGTRNSEDKVVVIENCTFNYIYHSVASFNAAHYVLRHCDIYDNRASIDAHGPSYASDGRGRGARATEIYNNTFHSAFATAHIKMRSGGGIIYNNTFSNAKYFLWFQGEKAHLGMTKGAEGSCNETGCYRAASYCNISDSNCYQFNNSSRIDDTKDPLSLKCTGCDDGYQLENKFSYPGFDQPTHWYIWGNTINNSIKYGNTVKVSDSGIQELVKKDRDYHMRAPTAALDGFTWSPSTYPHPLRAGVGPKPGVISKCGNNVLDSGEICEGSNFGGATCQDLGFDGGQLSCTDNCVFDTAGCTSSVSPSFPTNLRIVSNP